MEIKLKPTQKQILESLNSQKQLLQAEFGKLVQRENEIVASILEALNIELVEGIKLEGDTLIVPEIKNTEVGEQTTKLKKSK